ncbi:calcium-binding protein [Azonexus sp.]|uniref:calcium-binding protein n=1 Tax=Azonexus sp. TaxID=1872668 RepID=UPI0035AF3A09
MAITASNFNNWVYASNFGLDDVTDIVANATTVTITTSAGYTVTLTGKFANTGGAPEDITGTITQIAWTDADLGSDDNTIAGLKVDAAQLVNLVVTSEGLGWDSDAFEDRLNSLIYKGNDHIVGDATHYNYIFGGAGNDKLVGGDAGNSFWAFDGNDTITGGDGEDHVYTGNGNSKITTDGGNDYVVVGNGNNKISTGDGYDRVYAGGGNNTADLGEGDNGFYANVTYSEDHDGDIVGPVVEGAVTTTTEWATDSYTYAYASGNNKITSGDDSDYIFIGGGNNKIDAGNGSNVIWTTESVMSGEDYQAVTTTEGEESTTTENWLYTYSIQYGDGNNKVTGGDDYDYVQMGAGNNVVDLGDGYNMFAARDTASYEYQYSYTYDGESSYYTSTGYSYTSTYGDGNNTVTGGDGEDYVMVGGGNNTIKLGDGDNSVYAVETATRSYDYLSGEESSHVEFGDGNNKIVGGDGEDYVAVGGGDNVIKLGDGYNVVYSANSVDWSNYGEDYVFDFSDGGNNKITGGKDTDEVYVGSGNDTIQLGKGADGADAGAGSNKIDLGKSDGDIDWVDFNYNDFLTAAAEGSTAFNKVTNFGAEDQLWFELDIDTSQVLIQKGKIDLSNASNDGYVLALDTSSGKLYYDADGSGSAEQFVQIGLIQGAGVKGLTSANVFDDGDWIAIGNVSFV